MGHTHEAGFLTQASSSFTGNDVALPSVEEGLTALSKLASYAHIKLDRSSLRSQRLIDPYHLEKYMIHIESCVMPVVARHGFQGDPFFSHETYQPYEDSFCEWSKTIPALQQMYAAFPSVVQSLEVVDRIMKNEAAWKDTVRQQKTPVEIEALLSKSRETYQGKAPLLEPYTGP
jgi:hypothetical protein